uniref:Coiled-coil domain containing 12 n=1 Tax=Mustela putorius furo TaxID=9669 RepID=M3YUF9_MUSPF
MAATAAGVGRLEEEALRRKERLKALREKTGRKDKEDGEPKTKQLREGEEEGEKHRELRLRNYVPEDEDLKRRRVPPAKPVAVEEKVKEQLEAAKPEPIIEEVVSVLSPPGAHWGPVSAPSRCPMLLSSALSLLSLHFCVPFPPRSPWPSPPSRPCFPLSTSVPWGWAPPVLTCVCFLPRTWPTSRPESLTGERCHVGLAWTDWLLVPGTALWLGLSCPQSREMDSVDTQLHELTTACRTSWQDIKGA